MRCRKLKLGIALGLALFLSAPAALAQSAAKFWARRLRRSGFRVRQSALPRRLSAGDERAGLRRGTAAAD